VQHERQHGVAAALNTAAELAQGEYIAYLDDDDAFEPEHLWTLLAHLQRFAWQRVAYGDAVVVRYRIEENGQLLITGREPLPARPFSVQELSVGNIAPRAAFCTSAVALRRWASSMNGSPRTKTGNSGSA
jgi:glycosyltransferase involved in cell wall biosynthesis